MDDLIKKLPYFYDNEITRPIIDAEQIERDELFKEIKETLAQCFVSTATWGLDYWEEMLFIPHIYSKSYEERRSVIYAKMRGTRTTTVEVIRQIAMSFFEVENVEVIEDNSNYKFNIDLQNSKFETCNLQDLYNYIEIYKPAHLNYDFTFTSGSKIIINSKRRNGICKLPICNVTRVGTWWKQYADGSIYEGKVIQEKSSDGLAKMPICGLYRYVVKNAVVGISTIGSAIIGGD